MAVNIDNLKITITTEGGSGKGTENNPYTWDDIMLVATNIVKIESSSRLTRSFFYVPYALWIETDCYFYSLNESVLFGEDVDDLGSRIRCYTGYIEIENGLYRCNYSEFSAIGNLIITNTSFYDFRGLSLFKTIAKNCTFNCVGSTYWTRDTESEFTDCEMIGTSYGLIPQENIAVNLRNKFINCSNGILLGYNYHGDVRIENAQFINCNYDLVYQPIVRTSSALLTTVLVDPLVDLEKSYLMVTNDDRHMKLQLVTRMSFYISNAEGSLIKVYDKDNNIIYENEYSEGLTDDILYYQRYVVSQGIKEVPLVDEVNLYQPFKLVVSKEGYDDLVIENIEVTPGQPTIIRGNMVLTEPPIYVDSNMNSEINTENIQSKIEEESITGDISIESINSNINENNINTTISNDDITNINISSFNINGDIK